MAEEEGAIADEGAGMSGAGASDHVRGALSYLSASFIQERINNVEQRAQQILDRIIDFGLLADGYGPFESPVTPDMIQRMTPEQLEAFLSTIPSEEEKSQVLAAVTKLKLPTRVMLPPQKAATPVAPAPHLAFGPEDRLNSQGTSGLV